MRDSGNIESCVMRAVARRFGVPRADLHRSTRFREDLNADSLDAMELVIEAECDFDLTISDQAIERIRTIGDLIDYLQDSEDADGTGVPSPLLPSPKSDSGAAKPPRDDAAL